MTRDEKEKAEKKTPAPYQIYDKAFHDIFEEFREDIGVETKKDYQLRVLFECGFRAFSENPDLHKFWKKYF